MPLVKARPFPFFFFFFNDTATTEIYTLSLHDALPIYPQLVLEMAVLRLATLPPLLPVDDILRRLEALGAGSPDRKSTRLNSSHSQISYAVFCLKKKKNHRHQTPLIDHDRTAADSLDGL